MANFFKFNLSTSSLWDIIEQIGVLINPIFEKFRSDVALVGSNAKTNSKIFPTSDNSFLELGSNSLK